MSAAEPAGYRVLGVAGVFTEAQLERWKDEIARSTQSRQSRASWRIQPIDEHGAAAGPVEEWEPLVAHGLDLDFPAFGAMGRTS